MDTTQDPSLLEYARFYDIACDSAAIERSIYVDDTCETGETPPLHPQISDVQYMIQDTLREKLDVKKEGACFLASVARDAQAERLDIDWRHHLPPFDLAEDLKVTAPIFSIGRDPGLFHTQSPFRYEEDSFLQCLKSPSADPQEIPILDNMPQYGPAIVERCNQERLNCPKGSFIMLQDVKKDSGLSFKEIDDSLQSMIASSKDMPTRESPPLLIYPAENLDDNEIDNSSPYKSYQPFPNPGDTPQQEASHASQLTLKELPSTPSTHSPVDMFLDCLPSTLDPCSTDMTSPLDLKRYTSTNDSRGMTRISKRGSVELPVGSPKKRKESGKFSPLFSSLGSLSAFMESRGRSNRSITESPYFTTNNSNNHHVDQDPTQTTTDTPSNDEAIPQCIHQVPKVQRERLEVCIFLSTSLLKSHLRLTQHLDRAEGRLRMIYRDHGNSTQGYNGHNLPKEADMIITPTVGIILTTSQATTQLYLPGHGPTDLEKHVAKSITSPLRERIYHLAPRYECLYVVVCHGSTSPQDKQGMLTADKKMLGSLTQLSAFCSSLSTISTVTPVILPSSPETVAEWILALVQKHGLEHLNGLLQKIQNDEYRDEESLWELFLRRAGLNPYAAQAVLAVLGHEVWSSSPTQAYIQDWGVFSSLSMFIEMSTEYRRELFLGLIGAKMLERIDSLAEKDWHCDWALNFDN